jgi:hypothetical protein
MSIDNRMRTDRAARLLMNATAEIALACSDLRGLDGDTEAVPAGFDIAEAAAETLAILKVAADSAHLLAIAEREAAE